MSTQFGENGKIFTDVVTKRSICGRIQIATNHIVGEINILTDDQLSDELNRPEHFLPITNAKIFDINGKTRIKKCGFSAGQKSQIIWVAPESEKEFNSDSNLTNPSHF